MSVPKSVLLIRKKHKDTFFKENELSDGITSVLFDYSSYTSSFSEYTYNNITQLINDCLADGEREAAEKELQEKHEMTIQITNSKGELEDKTVYSIEEWEQYSDWNKVLLIPVLVTKDSSSSSSSSQVISIQHDLKPSYARLKGGKNPANVLKLEVVSTNFGTRSK